VRAGERATAVFLSSRLRMTASVTCLEHGREGEIIRVRGLDGHVFRARISGPALLEALPQ
jgi:flagella basal body P-ring formation protein FlgA